MKQIRIKAILLGMTVPIVFDIVAIVMALHGMAGGSYSEGLIGVLFYAANWPSLLFKLSPFNRADYGLLDCLSPKIVAFNVIVWGLVGILIDIYVKRYRQKDRLVDHTDN